MLERYDVVWVDAHPGLSHAGHVDLSKTPSATWMVEQMLSVSEMSQLLSQCRWV